MGEVVKIQGYPGQEIHVTKIDDQLVRIAIADNSRNDSVVVQRDLLVVALENMLLWNFPEAGLTAFELRRNGERLRIEQCEWRGTVRLSLTHDSPPRSHSIRIFHSHLMRLRKAISAGDE